MSGDRQAIRVAFLRLERDEELKARFEDATGNRILNYKDSEALDDLVWRERRMQRRLVEDVA